MQHEERMRWFLLVFLACFLVSSCASPARLAKRHAAAAENHVTRGQWLDAVMEYRKAYDKIATDARITLRLRQVELKAAEHYYQRGAMLYDKGDIEGAIVEYEQGLAAMPDNDKLRQSLLLAVAHQDAERLYAEGLSMQEAGRKNDARQLFEQVLKRYPGHDKAKSRWRSHRWKCPPISRVRSRRVPRSRLISGRRIYVPCSSLSPKRSM